MFSREEILKVEITILNFAYHDNVTNLEYNKYKPRQIWWSTYPNKLSENEGQYNHNFQHKDIIIEQLEAIGAKTKHTIIDIIYVNRMPMSHYKQLISICMINCLHLIIVFPLCTKYPSRMKS